MMPRRKLYTDDKFTAKDSTLKDRNIPMELRSTYASHAPKGDTYELALEHKYRHILNKKIQEKREKEEFTAVMHQWAYAKGRLDEEINRKNEALTFGSRFEVRAFNPRAQSATIHSGKKPRRAASQDPKSSSQAEIADESIADNENALPAEVDNMTAYMENGKKVTLSSNKIYDMTMVKPKNVLTGEDYVAPALKRYETEITKMKIERIKKLHSDLVFNPRGVSNEVGSDGAYSVNRPLSLSVYDNSQPSSYRPFSSIYAKVNDQVARTAQIEEIEDVKKKLAKFKIKVPIKTLESSLLLPQIQPEEKKAPILQSGTRLMTNPFFKDKKKKKGKKGKK